MDNQYPTDYQSPHMLLRGTALVNSSSGEVQYEVNFDTGECECAHGRAYKWEAKRKRWSKAPWCAHKLKAMSSLIEQTGDQSLHQEYALHLGRRYNPFVAVSAMHKEMRRGDVEAAQYWASAMLPHRGRHGVITYMRNIVFEETRDISLLRLILKLSTYGKSVSERDMFNAVARFTETPKKWDLPHRLPIFLSEMEGYRKLINDFGIDVAKPHSIIPVSAYNRLQGSLLEGFAEADPIKIQYGLKGLFKSKNSEDGNGADGHARHKVKLYNLLIDVWNDEHENAFEVDHDYTQELIDLLTRRNANHGAPGYHEINALCDALCGESPSNAATLPALRRKLLAGKPKAYLPPLGEIRRVPLYANDNHTWEGKAKMRRFGDVQLRPGANQTDIDFRLCGAYMGVAWRHLAVKQHGTINVPWGKVKWNPKWLWGHLDSMWY
jgi:hypothetical protein